MPELDWADVATWQDHLATLYGKRAAITGAPNFSAAGMSTDQRVAQEDLDKEIGKAQFMVKLLGGSDANAANRRQVATDTDSY